MATSLQRQLKSLTTAASIDWIPERRASILFDPAEASKIDRNAFYTIAISGLHELISLAPELFAQHKDSILFRPDSINLERSVESQDVNTEIDKSVQNFLITLSPFFMMSCSLKCLEWLIHRFHIEKFNVNSILQCILPYHDTKQFTLVIKVLDVSKLRTFREWTWLTPFIENAIVIRKAALFDNMNNKFISWLYNTLDNFVSIHQNKAQNIKVWLAFMTSTILGILNKISYRTRTGSKLKAICLLVFSRNITILNDKIHKVASHSDVISMVYLLTMKLTLIMEDNPEIHQYLSLKLEKLCMCLMKKNHFALKEDLYLLLNNLSLVSKRKWTLSSKRHLRCILQDVVAMSNEWDMGSLLKKLIVSNSNNPELLTPSVIMDYVKQSCIDESTRSEMLKEVYFVYLAHDNLKKWANSFITKFERQLPVEFELAKSSRDFRRLLVNSHRGMNLSTMCFHSDENVREVATKKLFKRALKVRKKICRSDPKLSRLSLEEIIVENSSRQKYSIVFQTTMSRLVSKMTDSSDKVAKIFLKRKVVILLKIFSTPTLFGFLEKLIQTRSSKLLMKRAVKKICVLSAKFSNNENSHAKVLRTLLPFMFPNSVHKKNLLAIILKSNLALKHPVLKHMKENVNQEDYSSLDYEKINGFAFDSLQRASHSSEIEDFKRSNPLNAMNIILFCISKDGLSTSEELENFLLHLSCYELKVCGVESLPISKSEFSRCVKKSFNRNSLSLELVLNKLLSHPLQEEKFLTAILTFIWRVSKKEENKLICSKFLRSLFSKSFNSREETIDFFCLHIKKSISNENFDEGETVRVLQLFFAFLSKHSFQKTMHPDHSTAEEEKIIKTRHQKRMEQLSTTRITRNRSVELENSNHVSTQKSESFHKSILTDSRNIHISKGMWDLLEVLVIYGLSNEYINIRKWALHIIKLIENKDGVPAVFKNYFKEISDHEEEVVSDYDQTLSIMAFALQKKDFFQLKNYFLAKLVSETTEDDLFLRLIPLCSSSNVYEDEQIFPNIIPRIQKVLEKDPDSDALPEMLQFYDCSLDKLELLKSLLSRKKCCKKVLKKITNQVFGSYSDAMKKKLCCLLVDSCLYCSNPDVKAIILKNFKRWTMDATIVNHELVRCLGMERRDALSRLQNRKKDKSKEHENNYDTKKEEIGGDDNFQDWKQRTEVVLEFIQGKKNIVHVTKLIPPLFRILKVCLQLEQQAPVEYLKQMVLSVLTFCCEDFESSNDTTNDKSRDLANFNVETVIECFRCSRNPQTHHHALILLNYASKRFTERVLHGVMSMFTYMGNSILRQDDSYSTQLIQRTVSTIIPRLVASGKNSTTDHSRSFITPSIIKVFVSAVQAIPAHRRVPVFGSLCESLDPKKCLWQTCIIIVDNALNRDNKRSNLSTDIDLAVDLVWNYGTGVVTNCLKDVFGFLESFEFYQMEEVTANDFNVMKIRQPQLQKVVIDFERKKSFRDVQIVIYYIVELVQKIASRLQEGKDLGLDDLLKKCFNFSRLVSSHPQDRLFRLVAHKCFEVIEKITSALNASNFLKITEAMLRDHDIGIKRKMLDILIQKILQGAEWFQPGSLCSLMEPILQISRSETEVLRLDKILLLQTSLFALKQIARNDPIKSSEHYQGVFTLALNYCKHENVNLKATALICLSELFCLKEIALPNMTNISDCVISSFEYLNEKYEEFQKSPEGDKLSANNEEHYNWTHTDWLCNSTVSTCNRLVEQLGTFLGSAFLSSMLKYVCLLHVQAVGTSKLDQKKKDKLKAISKTIGLKIPLRVLLNPLKTTFEALHNPRALNSLMEIMKESLLSVQKNEFVTLYDTVLEAFTGKFLCYRNDNKKSMDIQASTSVEDIMIDVLISGVVLKMSESQFRPCFLKLSEWSEDSIEKKITFFRFCARAAEKLKTIFVTFASNVIQKATDYLSESVELTNAILDFFYHTFYHDKEGLTTMERFDKLLEPFANLIDTEEFAHERMDIPLLGKTLIQLAAATNDLNRWQQVIDIVSSKAQSNGRVAKFFLLTMIELSAGELGTDFLPILPPAVPVLAELLSDEDTEIESSTQQLLLRLENVVGEPLQPYFSTE